MRIAAISDTHGKPFTAPPCDVFIHAGDMTARTTFPEQLRFMDQLERVRCTRGLLVPGNHDPLFLKYDELVASRDMLHPPRFEVLIDRAVEIDGRVFYGSPWTPPFLHWHFMKTEGELAEIYRKMPAEIDVLITHGPARGCCDGAKLGSVALAEAIAARKVGVHVFGHIHESGGQSSGIHHNVSALDLQYQVARGCTMFEI